MKKEMHGIVGTPGATTGVSAPIGERMSGPAFKALVNLFYEAGVMDTPEALAEDTLANMPLVLAAGVEAGVLERKWIVPHRDADDQIEYTAWRLAPVAEGGD